MGPGWPLRREPQELDRVRNQWRGFVLKSTCTCGQRKSDQEVRKCSQCNCSVFASLPDIRFHDVRNTAATLLLEKGIHFKIFSDLLGHGPVGITLNLYSHATLNDAEAGCGSDGRAARDEIAG